MVPVTLIRVCIASTEYATSIVELEMHLHVRSQSQHSQGAQQRARKGFSKLPHNCFYWQLACGKISKYSEFPYWSHVR